MQTTITATDKVIQISGPYSESNNETYRRFGGKFLSGAWVLPDNESVRLVIAGMFGRKSEEVEVLVPQARCSGCGIVQIGGYVLAQRRHRDLKVDMPEGVSLHAGSFPSSAGSSNNPRVAASEDTVYRLRVRRSFALDYGLEIVPQREIEAQSTYKIEAQSTYKIEV